MPKILRYISFFLAVAFVTGLCTHRADGQASPFAAAEITDASESAQDSVPKTKEKPRYPVSKTAPQTYEDLNKKHPVDLQDPENVKSEIEYDPVSNRYLLRTKVGDMNVSTPFSMSPEEYQDYSIKQSLNSYFKAKNAELAIEGDKEKQFSPFDMQFDLGPAEKLFGKGGVQLQTQGTAEISMGLKHNSTDNPSLPERARNRTFFDFDSKINLNVNAKIGEKINFGMNYNTDATFDYDSKKLKLAYEGKEDEIIKVLEAGNVSMKTSNSLIRGGAALFGVRTELQFGKLRVNALLSQQNSESKTVSSKGGVQTTPFELSADQYDENRHFFLAHYFRNHYDEAMSTLPLINSRIKIDRIEVWVTNKRGQSNDTRNVVAFADLGEKDSTHLAGISDPSALSIPYNDANKLYFNLKELKEPARDINQVTQTLEAANMKGGQDFEKIENARKLESSEYSYNSQLGYISLRSMLQPDEVLAIAISYTYMGKAYQLGEFASDNPNSTNSNLFLKLLKGTSSSPSSYVWHLMMKNVYSLNAYSVQQDRFKLDIMYQSDTTGVYLNHISDGAIAGKPLLQVMMLDRLNSQQQLRPDGFFDFVEGYTILSQNGKIIFPVVEPFGRHLREQIKDSLIANKYTFEELYDSTLTIAKQFAEKNKFKMTGEYKASSGSEIQLGAMNVARGSVRVTAGGQPLTEGTDYSVDYISGVVTILNSSLIESNTPISVSLENQSMFAMQRKTMMGVDLQYEFSKDFNFGATLMHLRETPLTTKANIGEESVRNTLWGLNTSYRTESQWLTNMVDKLPFLELTAPSQINFSAEFAQLIPGHYESEYGGKYSYVDDFERAKISYDLRSPYSWFLSAAPEIPLFPEAKLKDDVNYGKNRALLAWYYIDGLFTRRNSSLTPQHIKNDKEQLSNHYVREVTEYELFPNKEQNMGEPITVPVFNLAYYPQERGPYNIVADFEPDGTLKKPETRWGGIYRKMDQTDFESANIEYMEFWLMDPFIYDKTSEGGDLYINLGEISEDVLKDERKFSESAMPTNGDTTQLGTNNWGKYPKNQSLVYAFETASVHLQDVGLDGLSTDDEFNHHSYKKYLEDIQNQLQGSPQVLERWRQDPFSPFNDPAGDNYHYFRGSDYDRDEVSILDRYKRYNGLEGNTVGNTDEKYETAARTTPDVEDINQDFTMNENEKFFQYKISLNPQNLKEGQGYITNVHRATVTLANGNKEEVNWFQFKIPLKGPDKESINGMNDFRSIRFMRMFLTQFKKPVVLRFGTLELVRGEWRVYEQDLSKPNSTASVNGTISVSAVNLEENADRQPVNYVMPPGVNRVIDPGQPQIRQENEQALLLQVENLAQGDARAAYKIIGMDMRQYGRLQMFAHAEKLIDDVTALQNNEMSIFLRLGSDYKNNYYEYEIPLKLTPPGTYNTYSSTDQETVWPSENMFDFPLEVFTNLKLERNREKRKIGSTVTFYEPYPSRDPEKPMNTVTVTGNPSLAEVKTIMIGVRNNSNQVKSVIVWVNELRLTEFNESGGWAANANLNINLSDLGSVNLAGRVETAGFGGIDQSVTERSLDDYYQYNIATTVEMGKLFPSGKVTAPLYYAYSEQVTSPKYNPLDQDILLKDALDIMDTKAEKDSLKSMAQSKITSKSFNLSSIKLNVTSKNPMPYDPANFTLAYAYSESNTQNPTTEYERTLDQRGSFSYSYSPYAKPWQPFKNIKSKSGASKFAKDFGLGYLPSNISFVSAMSRTYYEVQVRDLTGTGNSKMPASFRQEFYWDRDFGLNWNLTKNLNFSLKTGTHAEIEEPYVQVNKQLFPDEYKEWKDEVWRNIRNFGTPLRYQQTFNATYNLPTKLIPILEWTTMGATYNASYKWDKGADLGALSESLGNTINNQRDIAFTGGMQLVNLYNKSDFLKKVNQKFTLKRPSSASSRRPNQRNTPSTPVKKEPRKVEKEIQLNTDSATVFVHNLKNKRVRVSAKGPDGRRYEIKFKSINENSIRINNKDSVKLNLTVIQAPKMEDETWYKVAQVAARGAMMIRTVNISYTLNDGMTLPGFKPNIGDGFGQTAGYEHGYAPGFDFAFGLTDKSYINKARDNGWLITNDSINVVPAYLSSTKNLNIRMTLEPIVGMKIDLTATRMSSRTNSIQFVHSSMPEQLGGSFLMTTVAIGSAFESSKPGNNYHSATFNKFLENRRVIADRIEQQYAGKRYPGTGFMEGNGLANQPYDPANGAISENSADVLIPAFLAAYTGGNPNSIGLTAFPSLRQLLPNWRVSYEGLIQLDLINKHFKSFVLNHNYTCNYSVGSYSSYMGWVATPEDDGLGYIQNILTNNPTPSSPFDISAASITEQFSPLIGLDATFKNNMTFRSEIKNTRNLTLNVSSYQLVESVSKEMVFGVGYKLTEFNKVLKMKASGAKGFSNDLTVRADVSFKRMQALIRKIEDAFTQATSGTVTTSIRISADYNLSRALTFRAYYDRDVNKPLVSSSAYPTANSSFGISLRLNLSR